jgi:hypothetical protein
MLQSSGLSHMLKVIWYQVQLSHRKWVPLPVQLQCLALRLHSVHGCGAVLCNAVLRCAVLRSAVLTLACDVQQWRFPCSSTPHKIPGNVQLAASAWIQCGWLGGCCPALL